jgi:hypothetical protein
VTPQGYARHAACIDPSLMMVRMRVALATTCLLAACSQPPVVDEGPDAEPDPLPDGGDQPPRSVTVTIDDLQAGWLVTTSRLLDHDMPDEHTIASDGSPITLVGTSTDVFVATITDASGNLIATRAMKAPCTMASSRQLHVPRDYPTIQGAIDAASSGDTVKVAAGTYTESVHLRSGVCLLGSGARRTILDAGGEGRTLVDLTNAPGSAVAGFTMRGTAPKPGCASLDPFTCSGDWYTAGVYLGNDGTPFWENPTINAPPIIANNILESNYIGVMLYHHGIAVVRNNIFVGNRNGFVANHYQDRTLLANNVFVGNLDLAIGNQAAYLDIIDNVIVESQLGVRFEFVQTGHIACNVFYGNGENASEDRFTIGSDGNVEAEPRFVGNGDYHLRPSSPGRDMGCHKGKVLEPDGTPPDIGAFGGPLAAWADL